MICSRRLALLLALVAGLAPAAGRAARPIVAVFPVEIRGVPGRSALGATLTSYLAARLVAGGRFEVVPQDRLRRALTAKKLDSHRPCYSQSCQIEIGGEVAASHALLTQLHRVGRECVAMSSLYDLRSATSGLGATARGACGEAALLRLVDGIAARLGGDVATPRPTARGPGELVVIGAPDGARVVVTAAPKRWECHLPCHLKGLPPRAYQLEVSAPGRAAEQRVVRVSPGRVVALSVELRAPGQATGPAVVTGTGSGTGTGTGAGSPDEGTGEGAGTGEGTGAAPTPRPAPTPLWKQVSTAELTPAMRARHQIPEQVNFGVVVTRVAAGSRLARGDLRVGDVLLEVNGQRIDSGAALRRALGRAGGKLQLLVHRKGKSLRLSCE